MTTKESPLLAGRKVRIRELRPVDFKDGGKERRYFSVYIDEVHGVVLTGGHLPVGMVLCADHGKENCEHKQALLNSQLLESESPFAEKAEEECCYFCAKRDCTCNPHDFRAYLK